MSCNKFIIPLNVSVSIVSIKTPAIIEAYIANSGLYCFSMTMIITDIKPIPIILIISIDLLL